MFDFFGVEVGELFVLQFRHSLGENLLIGFISQISNEAALFRTKQVARAADVEVLHGDVDARAEVGVVFNCLQSSSCIVGKQRERRCEQIAERLAGATSDSSSHLVKVGESEAMSSVNEDCVGVGNVNAVFDDGGRNEHVVVIVHKSRDDFFQFFRRHLSVPHGDAGIRNVASDQRGDVGKRGDARADDENLSVSAHLKVHGIGDDFVVKGVNLRLNRAAVGWRCLDDGEVAGTHQRELEGSWDGRGGHGQRVDVHLQLSQFLLHRHAEFLFFVDDEQAQVVPFHVLADEFVRADEDVHFSLGEVFQHVTCLGSGAGSAQIVHSHGEIFEARREGFEVLQCEDGGWHEHSHLLIVAGRFEGGAHGNFRFAKSHVATDKTVHRARTFHVALHFFCHAQLIRRVLVGKARFQFVLQERVGTEGKALGFASL